ncbi:uncharacterized protein LOC110595436, partial [Carlito syrichta]|uniref:Large ribosomal subunit protein uL29 n=1 Tax=Carlito syrichta TaxID=1868482 RepID=A0A3Q0DXY1_CARSF
MSNTTTASLKAPLGEGLTSLQQSQCFSSPDRELLGREEMHDVNDSSVKKSASPTHPASNTDRALLLLEEYCKRLRKPEEQLLKNAVKKAAAVVVACAAVIKIKAPDFCSKKKELLKQLDELKAELSQLRVAKVTGSAASKLSKIRVTCKSIACVLTVINQTQKENLRKFLKGEKYKPLDLRPKKTRALCHWFNKHEENLKPKKQQWKEWSEHPWIKYNWLKKKERKKRKKEK